MLERVKDTIAKYELLTKGERVIVGFSGGIDSLTLLHILANLSEYDLDIWAVYINHSLRPLENPLEERLLENIGREWGIKTKKFVINIPERLQQKPESIQLLAREERYKIFNDFRSEIKADKVALAHHLDDQVETILYRIIRGTGLDGLAGMPIIRDRIFIRPLLEVTRKEIVIYATANKLSWVEDSSNQKVVYQRNRIRHELLPMIEESFNPRFKESLLRLAKIAAEQREFIADLITEKITELLVVKAGKVGIRIEPFLKQPSYLQYNIIKQALAEIKPNYQIESVALVRLRKKMNQENYRFKTMHIFKGVTVYRENDLIFLAPPLPAVSLASQSIPLVSPGVNSINSLNLRVKIEPSKIPPCWGEISDDEIYIETGKLNPPLLIRFWRPGDVFWPLGSPGSQKLHDFFINHKIPRRRRGEIPLLVTADNRIIWVIGYRLSNDFKVASPESEVWRIEVGPIQED